MIKRKDNFTDAVEALERARGKKPEAEPKPQKPKKEEWQATDNEGNVVTLGQNAGRRSPAPNKTNLIELSPEVMEAIKQAVKVGVEEGLEEFKKRWNRRKS